ncbi:MAG TPA: sulfurtransferase [Acidimicrobiia bacterium]|nr:sulfurtransferase [Acidimicrobiia bacterium]
MSPLIGCEELSQRLDEVVLCDIRWSLTDAGDKKRAYEEGHVPGAVFVDLETDLTGSAGPGRHPLPSPEEFAATLGRLGISIEDEVVVYDDMSGVIAARMWWMLRSIGHHRSRLLDGGFRRWVRLGLAVATGSEQRQPSSYPASRSFTRVVTVEKLEGRVIIDARSPERYRGEVEPVDPKAGHIPGAINLPTDHNLDSDGTFLPADELRLRYHGVGPDPVLSCGSGVSACHNAVAMVLAGHELPEIYIGSFSEWSRLDLPVSTGPEP